MVRALSLFSGSLASRVATSLVERDLGVDKIFLLHFRSPFFDEYDAIRELVKSEWLGVSFRTQSLKKDYRRLANIPPGGCFSLKRSCLSCRTLMLSRAIRYAERIEADFIVTGELVDHNELTEKEMDRITEDLGIGGVVLRPLSARLLPPTRPEIEGWIDRENLGDLSVKDGDQLVELAKELGLSTADPMASNLRCKLTLPGFGKRLEHLFEEEGFTMNALKLLDFKLYYKKPPDVKIVLATDEEGKRALQNYFLPQDLRVYLPTHRGPMTLVRTNWASKSEVEVQEIIELASRITVTHSEAAHLTSVLVNYRFENDDETSQLSILPFDSVAEIAEYCLVCTLPPAVVSPGIPPP